eukprot:9697254-Lingulodinium_polyedra.AAC.1
MAVVNHRQLSPAALVLDLRHPAAPPWPPPGHNRRPRLRAELAVPPMPTAPMAAAPPPLPDGLGDRGELGDHR